MRVSLHIALIAVLATAMAGAPIALADANTSSNWAGYAVHRSGVSFHAVVAEWRQPSASCVPGNQTFSAQWVGLGGYSATSNALEQIGTEMDCSPSGRAISTAWYELVPAASQPISFRVAPGDTVAASVSVAGHRVVVSLWNLTRHHAFTKALNASTLDVSSAEWIVEAPSDCISNTSCQTLPLADFGSATFDFARAQSSSGHTGAISDAAWGSTKIRLTPGGRRFVVYHGSGPAGGAATPSDLRLRGTSFNVTYSQVSVQGNPFLSQLRTLRSGYIVHTGR